MSESVCGRAGCGKSLNAKNAKGVCASGCRSPDAPASIQRVKGSKKVLDDSALGRFRIVASALGKDPDALLAEFAEAWLEGLRKAADE